MTSILELFKISIGPSSSHTVGPMRAARRFLKELESTRRLVETDGVTVHLYGSLALTGKGHGTDRAIMLGLVGEAPDQVDPATIGAKLSEICEQRRLLLLGKYPIKFDPETDLVFRQNEVLPGHSNGMRFTAYDSHRQELAQKIFYSIGGGFILAEGEQATQAPPSIQTVPYPFKSAAELLRFGEEHQKPIWALVLENEKILRSQGEIEAGVFRFWGGDEGLYAARAAHGGDSSWRA